MLLLQEIVQGLIAKLSSLERFIEQETDALKMELINRKESLFVERKNDRILITMNEPSYLFEFKLYPGTPTWGEISCCVGETLYPVLIDDNGPAFSSKGYSYFREFANALSHKLEIEDWLNEAKLIGRQDAAPVKSEVELPVETFSRFQTIIHKILVKHDLLDAFYDPSCESVYLKLQQESYMDLVIERQYKTVFVGHYIKQNGDLISDPILVFQLSKGVRSWVPYRIEQVFGDSQIMFEEASKLMIYPKRLKEFKSFANMFAGNIRDQGWLEANVVDKQCVIEEDDKPESLDFVIIPDIIDDTAGQMAFGF